MSLFIGQVVIKAVRKTGSSEFELQETSIQKINEFTMLLDDGLEYVIHFNSAFHIASPVKRFGSFVYPSEEIYTAMNKWGDLYRTLVISGKIHSLPIDICRKLIKIVHQNYQPVEASPPKKIQSGDLLYFVPSSSIVCDPMQVMVTKIKKKEILTDKNRSFSPVMLDKWVISRTVNNTPIALDGSFYLSEESYLEHQLWLEVVEGLFKNGIKKHIDELPQILEVLEVLKEYID